MKKWELDGYKKILKKNIKVAIMAHIEKTDEKLIGAEFNFKIKVLLDGNLKITVNGDII